MIFMILQIELRAAGNLTADDIFSGLNVLRFKNNTYLTCESLVGGLISSTESALNFCGEVIPLVALENICTHALTMENFWVCVITVSITIQAFIMINNRNLMMYIEN